MGLPGPVFTISSQAMCPLVMNPVGPFGCEQPGGCQPDQEVPHGCRVKHAGVEDDEAQVSIASPDPVPAWLVHPGVLHSREFKEEAVELATRADVTIKEVAHDLGIQRLVLERCSRAANTAGGEPFPGKGHPRDEEVARLRSLTSTTMGSSACRYPQHERGWPLWR